MGFVYKEFTDSDIAKIQGKIKGPVVAFQNGFAVDEANDVYFISLGTTSPARDNERIAFSNLIWDGKTISIEAKPHFEETNGRSTYFFEMTKIHVPKALNRDLETIRKTIESGVEAYWKGFDPYDYEVIAKLPSTITRS
jgi:hypothetical protein